MSNAWLAVLAAEPAGCCWEEDNASPIQEIYSQAIWSLKTNASEERTQAFQPSAGHFNRLNLKRHEGAFMFKQTVSNSNKK